MVKLPLYRCRIEGNYNQWLEFKDVFVAMVHEKDMLTSIQNFYYLRASLEGQSIKSLEERLIIMLFLGNVFLTVSKIKHDYL